MKMLVTDKFDLELRTFDVSDAPALFALTERNRLYLREWLPWLDSTKSVQDSEGFIQFVAKEFAEKVGIVFGIWQGTQLLGVCSFQRISKSNQSAGIGYWISKDQSGKGIAKAVTQRLIEYGFKELNLHRIEIRCATGNVASQKVAEGCGLKYEGTAVDCERLYDRFVSHRVYAVVKSNT